MNTNELEAVLHAVRNGHRINYEEASSILKMKDDDLPELLSMAREITSEHFGRILRCYYPLPKFPPISVTGNACSLRCKHCGGYYLQHMIPAKTPLKLTKVSKMLSDQGAVGCLISGGYERDGTVPLDRFIFAIERLKKETELVIAVHTGLLNEKQARSLKAAGVDMALIDVVGNNETIRQVIGIDKSTKDYLRSLNALYSNNLNVAPHVCVGMHFGQIAGELYALKMISKIKPSVIVIISLIPTEGTAMEGVEAPRPRSIARVIAITRLMFPDIPIALGCMRSPGHVREELDRLAVQAGVDRISLPTLKTLQFAHKNGFKIVKLDACCALPTELEGRALRS